MLAIRIVAAAAIAYFALSTPGFTSPLAVNSLLNAISFIGCVAVGMTFITITGNIMSLALGATVSASALVFLASLSLGVFPAFLVAILFGVVITAVQGALVGYIRANPLLVSIAALSLLIGGAALATGGQRIYPGGEGLQVFKGRVAGMPVEALYFFGTVVIGQFVLSWTRIGREMIMVGSNLRAAIAAGVNTARAITLPMCWPAPAPPCPACCSRHAMARATWSLAPATTTPRSPPSWSAAPPSAAAPARWCER